jgi:hypothetical protein
MGGGVLPEYSVFPLSSYVGTPPLVSPLSKAPRGLCYRASRLCATHDDNSTRRSLCSSSRSSVVRGSPCLSSRTPAKFTLEHRTCCSCRTDRPTRETNKKLRQKGLGKVVRKRRHLRYYFSQLHPRICWMLLAAPSGGSAASRLRPRPTLPRAMLLRLLLWRRIRDLESGQTPNGSPGQIAS